MGSNPTVREGVVADVHALPIDHPTRAARAGDPGWSGYCPDATHATVLCGNVWLENTHRREIPRIPQRYAEIQNRPTANSNNPHHNTNANVKRNTPAPIKTQNAFGR